MPLSQGARPIGRRRHQLAIRTARSRGSVRYVGLSARPYFRDNCSRQPFRICRDNKVQSGLRRLSRPAAHQRRLLAVSDGVVEASQSDAPARSPQRSAEHRLDKILRAAEDEARDIRETVERTTTALLHQAHVEIAHRQRAQQDDWEQRQAVLTEAEHRAAAEVAAAQEHVRALISDAEREANLIRGHAHSRAQEIVDAAQRVASEMTRNATARVEILTRLRDETQADISRLLRNVDGIRNALAYELEAAAATAAGPPRPNPADFSASQHTPHTRTGLSGYRGNGQRVSRTRLDAATLFTTTDTS